MLQGSRILVTLEDSSSIVMHGGAMIEGMCYRASRFVVRRKDNGFHSQFHIVFFKTTMVERAWELLPQHAFNLITVSDFANGFSMDLGLIGKLKSVSIMIWN